MKIHRKTKISARKFRIRLRFMNLHDKKEQGLVWFGLVFIKLLE